MLFGFLVIVCNSCEICALFCRQLMKIMHILVPGWFTSEVCCLV